MKYDNHIWLISKEEYVIVIVMEQATQLITSKLDRLLWKFSKRESASGALLQRQNRPHFLNPLGERKIWFFRSNFYMSGSNPQ